MKRYLILTLSILIFSRCTSSSSSGTLDTSFGSSGKVTTNFSGTNDELKALVLDSDGKIIAVGKTSNGSNDDFAVARYLTNGTLDTTFGTGGVVTTDFSSQNDVAYAVKLQSDGKIVVAGTAVSATGSTFAMARYTTTGVLDTTFGSSGVVTTAIGATYDEIRSMAIQSNDAIVVGGFSKGATYFRAVVARYTSVGVLDTTFNSNGQRIMAIGSQDCQIYDVIVESTGLITSCGTAVGTTDRDFLAARLLSDGSLDTNFNGSGTATQNIGSGTVDTAYSLKKNTEGKYVIAGTSSSSTDSMAVIKLSSTGALDTTFATQGLFTGKVNSNNTTAKAMLILAADKILTAGTESGTTFNFGLIKASYLGVLDFSFGTSGALSLDFNSNLDDLSTLAVQTDGKILVGGRTYNGSNYDFALARLLN